jgi:hypothetical protein
LFCASTDAGAQTAKTQTETASVCQRCHEAGLPVPVSHPKVKGLTISECGGCHTSRVGQANPYAFAARLQRVECVRRRLHV